MSAQESHNTLEAHQVEDAQSNEEEFIDVNEVGEEVYDDDGAAQPPPDDDDNDADEMEINDEEDEHEHETLEIDMSNNSWSYFDKHQDSVFTIVAHPRLPMVLTGGGDNVAYHPLSTTEICR